MAHVGHIGGARDVQDLGAGQTVERSGRAQLFSCSFFGRAGNCYAHAGRGCVTYDANVMFSTATCVDSFLARAFFSAFLPAFVVLVGAAATSAFPSTAMGAATLAPLPVVAGVSAGLSLPARARLAFFAAVLVMAGAAAAAGSTVFTPPSTAMGAAELGAPFKLSFSVAVAAAGVVGVAGTALAMLSTAMGAAALALPSGAPVLASSAIGALSNDAILWVAAANRGQRK